MRFIAARGAFFVAAVGAAFFAARGAFLAAAAGAAFFAGARGASFGAAAGHSRNSTFLAPTNTSTPFFSSFPPVRSETTAVSLAYLATCSAACAKASSMRSGPAPVGRYLSSSSQAKRRGHLPRDREEEVAVPSQYP